MKKDINFIYYIKFKIKKKIQYEEISYIKYECYIKKKSYIFNKFIISSIKNIKYF